MDISSTLSAVFRTLGLRTEKASAPRYAASGHPTFEGIPRMPALFGRQPGPRQRPASNDGYPSQPGKTLATWVAMRAKDPEQLAALLPKDFTLTDPLLIAEAVTLSDLPWLAGRGYEMLVISVPVSYNSPQRGEITGRLALVVFEDCADAVISGREELGWNKLYADSMTRTVNGADTTYTVGWGGTEFFRLDATIKNPVPEFPAWRSGTLMHYRVFPRTGEWGRLEVEQVTGSESQPNPLDARSMKRGTGSFSFTPAAFEALPTLVHLVDRLAQIELTDTVNAGQATLASWSDLDEFQILGTYPT
ncbi:acetoacetate decarboxylase family protein [Williamsia sterculiae]|uniref:Acetoacetate decarboxylase (ADC) n=1 Tax=Williamsia sterculiae TaxID=1344003 RepID=A0A1N7HEX7_9NOCA|nr:acetoacetate decarboxylase family protein [Williamsia sterculiae]SIS23436.1 Acetoacetate decarboxylase (ADC) [Williamsia sterculiae]